MDNSIKLLVHEGSSIVDSIIVTPYSATRYEQRAGRKRTAGQADANIRKVDETNTVTISKIRLNRRGYNAYLVSAYVVTLTRSQTYRSSAHKALLQYLTYKFSDNTDSMIIFVRLRTPKRQFLDRMWNERMTQMTLERREVDHAMSWLSTLGGAFSALGDEFQHCAEIAGKISVKQFELALRLGDPLLVARCQLYAALSLIQQGRLKTARKTVRSIYKFSISQNDVRLRKMCHGVWAKLQYYHKKQKERDKAC